MKKIILFCLLIVSFLEGNSQELIWKLKDYKKGIYKTYEEFITNAPSIDLTDFEIRSKKASYGLMGIQKLDVMRFNISRKEAKKVSGIVGFSDGSTVYINPAALKGFNSKTNFYPVEFYGQFIYLDFIKKTTTQIGSQTSSSKYIEHGVFNLVNGKFIELNKYTIREILQSDQELLQAFENEKGKKDKVKAYFIKFVERLQQQSADKK